MASQGEGRIVTIPRPIRIFALALALLTTTFAPLTATAQEDALAGLEVENASTVRTSDATPAASSEASPVASGELTGFLVGHPDAPVTLQIYADYQCPHCRNFAAIIEPQLIEDYVATGQVRIEFLDFTVVGVPSIDDLPDDSLESVQAAEAAMCAAEQDAYLDYRTTLISGEMQPNSGAFSNENLIGFAEELGLDADRFADCLENGVYEDAVIAFVHQAIDRGVQGTPTLSINGGEPFFLDQTGYEGLQQQLDAALGS
jgi:protein-disulfide isomerase